jgi:hypothetical protein
VIARPLLRAHQLRSVGPGQRWLVEREWLADHRVMQRVNEGRPLLENDWRETARWSDLDTERARLRDEGWEIDPSH